MNDCPCGSGRAFVHCCEPLHAGAPAPDAEALMRSRYCAFVRGDADYLLRSWHPDTRPPTLELEAGVRWLGLKVLGFVPLAPDRAEVEFVARSRIGGGSARRHHERSRFLRDGANWFYVDGELQN